MLLSILQKHTTLHKSGSRYTGPCPKCKGWEKSTQFSYNVARGFFHCYSCGFNSGVNAIITALRELEGLSCPAAHQEAGIECDHAVCPVWDKCRKGATTTKPRRNTTPITGGSAPKTGFTPMEAIPPAEKWVQRATKLVEYAHEQLLSAPDQLTYLSARGLDLSAVRRYRLGWNPADIYRERSSWGLPTETNAQGKPKKLWIPRGLIIPSYSTDQIERIRVRRTNEDLEADRQRNPEKEPLRYYAIPGSGNDIAVIGDPAARAVVVVESDLDALLIHHLAGDICAVIPLTTVSARPKTCAAETLSGAVVILVALDFDSPRTNKITGRLESPAASNWSWWCSHYPQAERWPVPQGKDQGEAFQAGISLRAWVLDGLPISLHPKREHDGTGAPASVAMRIIEGREVWFPRTPEEWRRLVAEGKIVLGPKEAKVMRDAPCLLPPASLLMEIKEVFPGAVIVAIESI